jgi:hypothetical protein
MDDVQKIKFVPKLLCSFQLHYVPLWTPCLGLCASSVEAVTFRTLYVPTYLQPPNGKGAASMSLSTELHYTPVQGL